MGRMQPCGAWAFLPVSREGGGQCDFPSPSVNGPMENSSVQLTADSVTGLQGQEGCASLLPLLSSEHVEFLLFQRRRKLTACHRRAKPSSDAEGDAFRWRHEVPPSLSPFLLVLFCALVCQDCWGCPLLKS